jgi:hypothetical protein
MPAREARMKSERVGVPFAGASVSSVGRSALAMALVFSVSLLSWQSPSAAEEVAVDTCVDCHSTPTFLVTNRKLFDYFQKWTSSLHKQEGVTCVDCHGGDPTRADKQDTVENSPARRREALSTSGTFPIPAESVTRTSMRDSARVSISSTW